MVRARRMVRSFTGEPVDPACIDEICDLARRGPSAGNTAAVSFLVLEGPRTADYWDTTLPAARRAAFKWPGLLRAPVLIVVWTEPGAYLRRYQAPDKEAANLGRHADDWPVPYWFVDAGAAVMTMLLAAADRGLGACVFGLFQHEDAVRRRFGVPDSQRAVGTVAIGHPAEDDRASRSARLPRKALGDVIHRAHW